VPSLREWRDWEEPEIRERPIGLIGIALVALVAGVAILLAAGEMFLGAAGFGDWTKPRIVGNDYVGAVQVYPEHYLLVGALLLIPGLLLIAVPVGILRQRPWAQILGSVLGGLFLGYGILALVIPGGTAALADRWHPAAGLPWVVLGAVLLWYFNRRPIRRHLGMGDRYF